MVFTNLKPHCPVLRYFFSPLSLSFSSLEMATAKLSLSLFALFALVANYSAAYGALVPEGDCSKLILTLADCLPFVSKDSTTTTPAKACCLGLKIVAKANADCLCHTFKNSASLGIVLNVTKALSLPAACDISDPALSECKCKPNFFKIALLISDSVKP